MSEQIAYDEDARWLQSDGLILGRIRQSKGKQGILLSLDMPGGMGELLVEVMKTDAGSMTQFCEMARGAYYERKAEQEAKALRAAAHKAIGTAKLVQSAVPAPQETLDADFDLGSVGTKLLKIQTRLFDVYAEKGKLEREQDILLKIMEVLSAFENDAEKLPCIPEQESVEDGDGVGSQSREAPLQRSGEESLGRQDREAALTALDSFPAPDSDPVDGSED